MLKLKEENIHFCEVIQRAILRYKASQKIEVFETLSKVDIFKKDYRSFQWERTKTASIENAATTATKSHKKEAEKRNSANGAKG